MEKDILFMKGLLLTIMFLKVSTRLQLQAWSFSQNECYHLKKGKKKCTINNGNSINNDYTAKTKRFFLNYTEP